MSPPNFLPDSARPSDRPNFCATHWSLVLAAQANDSSHAQRALAELCEAYWYPLYAFVRRLGYNSADAEDATQGFLADLLRRQAFGRVVEGQGRFRSFLITSLKNFLSHERERASAAKRGGGQIPVPLDAASAEERYRLEPVDTLSPDKLFDRRWALTLLENALARVQAAQEEAGKGDVFRALAPLLTPAGPQTTYAEVGAPLGLSEGAVKTAVFRLRQQYRAALRAAILETVSSPAEVDEELRHLLAALGD